MTERAPPFPNVDEFNNLYWLYNTSTLSIVDADRRYLKWPTSQGSETISGALTVLGNTNVSANGIHFADGTSQTTAASGGGGSQTLEQTLGLGNTPGANDINMNQIGSDVILQSGSKMIVASSGGSAVEFSQSASTGPAIDIEVGNGGTAAIGGHFRIRDNANGFGSGLQIFPQIAGANKATINTLARNAGNTAYIDSELQLSTNRQVGGGSFASEDNLLLTTTLNTSQKDLNMGSNDVNNVNRIKFTSDIISIGSQSGQTNQGPNAISIGNQAGRTNQGTDSVAIGGSAGKDDQGNNSVAVGILAGTDTQGELSVAVGYNAGKNTQGNDSVAIGCNAAVNNQGDRCIAVGNSAGNTNQGNNSIALGNGSGSSGLGANSICIHAAGGSFNPVGTSRCFINPVRGVALGLGVGVMSYDPVTREVVYSTT